MAEFRCSNCGRVFRRPQNLKWHEATCYSNTKTIKKQEGLVADIPKPKPEKSRLIEKPIMKSTKEDIEEAEEEEDMFDF